MEETSIHRNISESNRQSVEYIEKNENRSRRSKTQMSAGKVLISVFWDAYGILLIDYLEKGRLTNSKYYMASLVRLKK